MRKFIILLLIFLVPLSLLYAAEISTYIDTVKTELSNLKVGDRIFFNVDITHDAQSTVEYIQQKPSEIFMLIGFGEETKSLKEELLTSFQFVSAIFDTGIQKIPAQEFIIKSSADSTIVYSDTLEVNIKSVLANDSTELKDIKSPLRINLGFWDVVIPLLIIMAIIVVIIIITRKKKGLPLLPEKKKIQQPAHVIALHKIEQLKLHDYLSKGEIKRYYIEVSWICREYLENRYNKPFLEMTAFEIKQALSSMQIPQKAEINDIIRECDRVKFAKYIPPLEDAEKTVNNLIEIIHLTKEKDFEETNNEN
ncbi:MAG TPA: hypothetical protein ENG70_05425 [Candidatus Cloacimonetes bacterium]|nr:hypothetical protein [Candidatus Cloacimonadota bacterium]HEX38277.1 hypothetical protein [Candidatus Cloacimonadota bacterium]